MGARTQTDAVTNSIPPPPPGFEPETPSAAPAGFVPEGNLPVVPATSTSLPGSTQRLRDSVNNGELSHSFTEPTQFERDRPGKGVTTEGVGKGVLDSLGGMVKGAANTIKTLLTPNSDADTLDLDPRSAAAHRATTQGPGAFDQLGKEDAARKDAGYGLMYRAAAPIAENTGIASPQSAEAHAARGEGGAIIGENLPAIAASGLGLAGEAAGGLIPDSLNIPRGSLRNAAAKLLRNPATARQSQIGKPGTITDILPPQAQKWVLPSWAVPKGDLGTVTNPGQFAEIPVKVKPAPAELGSPDNPGLFSKIPTKMPKPAATDPFAGATSTAASGAPPATLPPVPSNGNGFHGNPTPFAGPTASSGPTGPISLVDKFSQPGPGKALILPAEEPVKTGSEGRPATWTNDDVTRLATTGNRDAISQSIFRGKQLPPNARYVMGDPDTPRAVLNPRSVTKFTPDGQPIENLADPRTVGPAAAPSPLLPPVPQSNVGTPAPSSTTLTPPSNGGPSASPRFPEPSQPIHPQEVADLSRQLGRPVSAAEVPDIRRRFAAQSNIDAGLAGNRQDLAGNIREAHRAKLESPKDR